jgi:hypothetical protein
MAPPPVYTPAVPSSLNLNFTVPLR